MSGPSPAGIPRLGPHLRAQHGLLALCVLAALASGLLLGAGQSAVARLAPALLRSVHLAAGLGATAVLLYHVAVLFVLGYVEGRKWAAFPLAFTAADRQAAGAEIGYLLGRRPERPAAGDFRVSQKLMYWSTAAGLAGSGATGILLAFWERLGFLASLGGVVGVHRGLALVMLATFLWHLYGAFVWEGAWAPEWSWLTGRIDAEKARRKLPGFHRRHQREEDERAAALQGKSAEDVAQDRRHQEAEDVQAELARGNQLALEEKFVEALYHYRRALEMYPGYAQARYNMARVLARMGEREMAREAYRHFLAADPFHPLAGKAREALRELGEEQP